MTAERDRIQGVRCLIISTFFFSLMGVFVRLTGELPTFEKAIFRNAVSLVISAGLIRRQRIPLRQARRGAGFVFLRALAGTVAVLCNFYALDRISLSDASMLNKMSPFYAVLFSGLMLGERVSLRQVLLIAGAFCGSLLIVKPNPANLLMGPTLVAAFGGVMTGLAFACVRAASHRGVSGPLIVLANSAFSCVAVLPLALVDFIAPTPRQLACLILCGCCSALGQFSVTKAYTLAPAREISVFDNMQVVFSAMLGLLVFQQMPDMLSILGYVVVIGFAAVSFLCSREVHRDSDGRKRPSE